MTTIATDGKTLAADSLITAGGDCVATNDKIRRAADGSVFGAAGPSADCARFRRWMIDGGERPELGEEFCALVLSASGKVTYYCHKLEPIEYSTVNAIGSGADFAIGAMLAGASPVEAVKIACIRDVTSGGDVTEIAPASLVKAAA